MVIAIHGSFFTNVIFLRPQTVSIAIMPSRHIEYAVAQLAVLSEVSFSYLHLLDVNRLVNCPYHESAASEELKLRSSMLIDARI